MRDKPILTTLDYPQRDEWNELAEVVRGSRMHVIRTMLKKATPDRVVVLDGSPGIHAGNPDLAVAAMLGLRPKSRRPAVVMAEANWKPGAGLNGCARRLGMQTIGRGIDAFCVVSRHEEAVFASTWGLADHRIAYTPFYWTLSDDELAAPTTLGSRVFAGGNPMRDYGTLIEAVRPLDVQVTIATSRPDVINRRDIPANVQAGRIPHDRFMVELRDAGVVAVPLQSDTERSGGEQTYLNAMAMGKPVVVTDCPGVRDYVRDGETATVVPPKDPIAMRDAISWALDPDNRSRVSAMAAAARADVLSRFGPRQWVESLIRVASGVATQPFA